MRCGRAWPERPANHTRPGPSFGGAAREDPGGAYYPVVWIFRTTPWVVLGLVGLAARRRSARWRDLLLLGALALVFGVGVTLSPKKFDRYLLPVFPLVDIIAAVGLVTVFRRIFSRRGCRRGGDARQRARRCCWSW